MKSVELADQTFVADDLDKFFKKYAPDLVGTQPILRSVDGGKLLPYKTTAGDVI